MRYLYLTLYILALNLIYVVIDGICVVDIVWFSDHSFKSELYTILYITPGADILYTKYLPARLWQNMSFVNDVPWFKCA